MKMKIDDIKIKNRIREDLGNLEALKQSISSVGQLNPILVDENHDLIAGHRRLTCCKDLGWKEIEVRVLKIGEDELHKLELECHENLGRLELTSSEFDKYLERKKKLSKVGLFKRIANFIKKIFQKIGNIFKKKEKE